MKPSMLISSRLMLAGMLLAGCSKPPPTTAPVTQTSRFGTPSLAGISDFAHSEAWAAFEHAKRFITTSGVDVASIDLSRPSIFHFCPPQEIVYDWHVSFPWVTPRPASDYSFGVAVRNDGTCWITK